MSLKEWDIFEEEIAELVVGKALPFGEAIRAVVYKYPKSDLEILLWASISFCVYIDQYNGLENHNALLESHHRYELIAALAGDIATLSNTDRTCASLAAYWVATEDRMFSHR